MIGLSFVVMLVLTDMTALTSCNDRHEAENQ